MSNVPQKPRAALDVRASLLRLGEMVCERTGSKVWNAGLGDLVEIAVDQCGLPAPITAEDFAGAIGLRPNPKRRGRGR